MSAFLVSLWIMVVLESILDVPPACKSDQSDSFLLCATNLLHGMWKFRLMWEEEALLDEIHKKIPVYWAHSPKTLASKDKIWLTQAEHLHCAKQFVWLLIHCHRFSEYFAERTSGVCDEEQTVAEKEALIAAHEAALQVVSAHANIAQQGLMTYCERWVTWTWAIDWAMFDKRGSYDSSTGSSWMYTSCCSVMLWSRYATASHATWTECTAILHQPPT